MEKSNYLAVFTRIEALTGTVGVEIEQLLHGMRADGASTSKNARFLVGLIIDKCSLTTEPAGFILVCVNVNAIHWDGA